MAAGSVADTYGGFRSRLVEQLRAQGIEDLAILRAFGEIPRHRFVPEALLRQAYEDTSLPIGNGQTISQPSTQARYLAALALRGHERVLEIGTGSGYQAALLSLLVAEVISVERIARLARSARAALESAGVDGVRVFKGDGSLGWPDEAPYDGILVAAATPKIPQPLVEQLVDGGRLVLPLERGERGRQELVRVTRRGSAFHEECLGEAQFVPLIGRHGYPSSR